MNSVIRHSREGIARPAFAMLAIVGLGLGALACGGGGDEAKAEPDKKAEAPPAGARQVTFTTDEIQHGGVKWSAVHEMTVAPSVELPGKREPDENKTIHVSTPAQGRLLTVRVNVGDRVARGQVLASIQSEGATSARADYAKAVAELNARKTAATYARLSRERAERLLEMKAGSRQDVDRARTDDEVAQAAVVQASAEVERAKEELSHLNVDNRGEIVLRSTIAGVVLTRDAVAGTVVEPGAPLLTITDPNTLWLQIAASEAVASSIRPSALIRFSVRAFPDEPFEARVENIGGALDPDTRTPPCSCSTNVQSSSSRGRMAPAGPRSSGATWKLAPGKPAGPRLREGSV